MQNERDANFTPSPGLGATTGGVEFTPSPGIGTSTGASSTGGTPTGGTTAGGATTGGSSLGAGSMGGSSAGRASTGGMGGQSQSGGTAQQTKEKAQELAGQVQQKAAEQVQSRLQEQKHRAAESLSSVAQTLRSSSQQLHGQQDGVSRYFEQAADRVEDLANYLENRDLGELVDQAERFARRNPAAFLGGAFALGLLGARFLKSSRRSLVHEGVRERWSTQELTSRVDDAERDAVGRPRAPGYAPPSERAGSDPKSSLHH